MRRRVSSRCGRPASTSSRRSGGRTVNDAVARCGRRASSGADAKVRLVLWTDDGAEVAASNGAGAWDVSRQAVNWIERRLAPHEHCRRSSSPPSRCSPRSGSAMRSNTLVVRLSVRDENQGAIIVQSPSVVPPDIVDSLEVFASQVSLALEAASLAEDLHRQKSEARFRSLVAHSSDLITVLDGSGVVTYQSPSIERVLGYAVDEVEGERFDRLLAEADRSRLLPIVNGGGSADAESHTFDCSLQHHDGRWLQFEVQHTQLLEDEHIRGIVLNSRDVSERKAFEDQLAHQAFHDPVTDLANRALFADRVSHALRSTVRSGSLIAVMFIDLDDFKTVNDSLGHQAGDVILTEVARRLERAIRPADTVARFGGDEFAILLDGVSDSDEAALIAERLLGELEVPTEIDGKQVYPRASVGICMSDEDLLSQDAEELLRNADVAMYMAKRDSKGQVPPVRARDARARRRTPRAAGRAPARARARAARGLLPAGCSPQHRSRLRRRSAAALAPPDPRPDPAGAVHSARRGDRADHPDRQVGDRGGLPQGSRAAEPLPTSRAAPHEREPLREADCSRTRSSTTSAGSWNRRACPPRLSYSRSPRR